MGLYKKLLGPQTEILIMFFTFPFICYYSDMATLKFGKGSGDNESLACKCWSNWSKLEQTDLGGQMTPMVGHWLILKGFETL